MNLEQAVDQEAASVAQRLATESPAGSSPLDPPTIIADGCVMTERAKGIWRILAPELARLNFLRAPDRPTFAIFCVYLAEWLTCTEVLNQEGHYYDAVTVAGASMGDSSDGEASLPEGTKLKRLHPAVKVREIAMRRVDDLSKRFGLTPLDYYGLVDRQRQAVASGMAKTPLEEAADKASQPVAPLEKPSGLLARLSSPPPMTGTH